MGKISVWKKCYVDFSFNCDIDYLFDYIMFCFFFVLSGNDNIYTCYNNSI